MSMLQAHSVFVGHCFTYISELLKSLARNVFPEQLYNAVLCSCFLYLFMEPCFKSPRCYPQWSNHGDKQRGAVGKNYSAAAA